jgi:hypothetical protein
VFSALGNGSIFCFFHATKTKPLDRTPHPPSRILHGRLYSQMHTNSDFHMKQQAIAILDKYGVFVYVIIERVAN